MTDYRRSRPTSSLSTKSNSNEKSSRKSPIASFLNKNAKQIHKTPIYRHVCLDEEYYKSREVLSDFVYIPSTVSKNIKVNARSETTYNHLSKAQAKGNYSDKKPHPKSKINCNITQNFPVGEKIISKKLMSVAHSEPPRKNQNFADKTDSLESLKEIVHGSMVKPNLSKYVVTEENKKIIESTLPPGETIIIPKLLYRVSNKRGKISNMHLESITGDFSGKLITRKCYCKFSEPIKPKPVIAKNKHLPDSNLIEHKTKTQFLPVQKQPIHKSNSRMKSNEIFLSTLNVPEVFGSSKKRPRLQSRTRFKKPVQRLPEKKVDENIPYKALARGSMRRLDKMEYQRYFNLRIRGQSQFAGLKFDPVHIYSLGERGSGLRSKGEVQDFYKLRDELLETGNLFEDPDFPPVDSSLYYSQLPDRRFQWKRPHEICDNPQLFVEGYSRFDVQQGELGDCWLLAAVANLTLYRRLFFQVVPDDQGFEEKYAGIFHFRFWQYGRWIDVVIDDRLPTYNGQLVFLHSTEENEFWSALLEKAYAKLHGSYEALKGGSTCEAMEDFTGGVTEMYEMNASPPNLFKIVLKAYERSSLMGCSLEPDPNVLEAETREGLIRGHAYSITRVKYVDIQTPNTVGKIPLLRLRNPWGNESEWNGPWSDKSPEWRFIPESEKEDLGLTFDDDGEFWMSFKDFQSHFDRLEICNLNPDSLTEEELQEGHKKRWEVSFFEGEWVRGVTAGGCRNYIDTFWHNPQYRITLTEVDEGDDDGKCTLIVALMQKNRRSQRNMGIDILTIGFAIYHLPYPDAVPKPLNLNFFKYNASVARSPSFINLREVSCRFKLPPGTYCIVPSTFEPNEEGEFLLRVFSEHQNNMEENDEDIGYGEVDQRVMKKVVTQVEAVRIDLKHASSGKKVKEIEPTPEQNREKDQVYQFFLKLAGEDGEVDWMELKEILDYAMRLELRNKGFSKDVCRSMVAMLDADHSGKLGFEEFKSLWSDIRDWKNAFRLYDRDNSGTLDGFELRQALNSAGYHLNYHILNILMHRYGNKQGQLEFDDFIMCAVKLKTMIGIFKDKDADNTNNATFSIEEWIEHTLYC